MVSNRRLMQALSRGSSPTHVTIPSDHWQNRGITSSNGSLGPNTKRLVPTTFINGAYKVTAPTGYQIALFLWMGGVGSGTYVYDTYQGGWTGSAIAKSLTWHTEIDTTDIPMWYQYNFVPVVRKTSDTDIATSEGENIDFEFYTG